MQLKVFGLFLIVVDCPVSANGNLVRIYHYVHDFKQLYTTLTKMYTHHDFC